MAKLNDITRLTENKFLNLYSANFINEETGKDFNYFIASRKEQEDLSCVTQNHLEADAVMMATRSAEGGVYLLKQFRPAINDYILEFPAGLIDSGETPEEAAIRELKEETGLTCVDIAQLTPACYTSVGMSDESVIIYSMLVEGIPSTKNKEENEDIEVLYFGPDKLHELLMGQHGPISMKTMLVIGSINLSNALKAFL